ncbi:MAG: DUF748 domain-containing protein [Pseudomonadota bacterium]
MPTRYRRLRFWLSAITVTLVVLLTAFLILLPYAMEWGAERMLMRSGARSASIADIDFNPVTGHLTVFDLKVQGSGTDRVLMERLVVKLDPFRLLKKRIYFRDISMTGFFIDLRQAEDGTLTFGGLVPPASEKDQTSVPEDGEPSEPWGLGLRRLDVKELTVHFVSPDLDETFRLDRLNLAGFRSWEPERSGEYVLRMDILGGAVDVEGEARPFSAQPGTRARIAVRDFPLGRVIPYITGTPVKSLSGSISGRGNVNTAWSLNPSMTVAGSVSFDIFSRNILIEVASGGSDLEFKPGALNADIDVSTDVKLGKTPSRKVDFKLTSVFNGSTVHAASGDDNAELLYDSLDFEVTGSYSDTGSADPSKLNASARLSLNGITLNGGPGGAKLAGLASLDIEGAAMSGTRDMEVSSASLGRLTALPRRADTVGKGEPGQVLSLGDLTAKGIRISDGSRVAIDTVQIDSLDTWVLRKKGGSFEALDILNETRGPEAGNTDKGQPVSEPSGGDSPSLEVGKLLVTGNNSLTFRDMDVSPPFTYRIDSLAAEVLGLDTAPGAGAVTASLKMGMGKYSEVALDTTVKPPWAEPDLDMAVRIKAIDLPPLTPYTARYLGYTLNSGHLNTDVDMNVEDGDLTAEAKVVVNRIEMKALKEEDEQRAEERLGIPIPVNTALSLLKDNNDDISLKIPVEGDLADPQFKISDVIFSATGRALQQGVTSYYKGLGATLLTGGLIPPGTFSILGKLFTGVTAMRFDPVAFEPMATELDQQSKDYLDLMAEKLAEKPKVRLMLCGKVTGQDILALRQADREAEDAAARLQEGVGADAGETAAGDNPELPEEISGTAAQEPPAGDEAPLIEEEETRLIEVAKLRALAVKDYLTQTGGLDPERLFVCYSEVDREDKVSPPRVELSI